MISKFFQSKNPFAQVLFIPIIAAIWLLGYVDGSAHEVIGNQWFEMLKFANPEYARVLGWALVISAGLVFSAILARFDLDFGYRNLASFVFMMGMSILPSQLVLNPLHLALLPLLASFFFVLLFNQKADTFRPLFYASFFLGIAGLFYPPLFVMTLIYPILIAYTKGWSFRYLFWITTGVLLPIVLISSFEFIFWSEWTFTQGIFISPSIVNISIDPQFGMNSWSFGILIFYLTLISLGGSFCLFSLRGRQILKIQQRMGLLWSLQLPLIALFVFSTFWGQGFKLGLVGFPLAIFFVAQMRCIPKAALKDAFLLSLFALVIFL